MADELTGKVAVVTGGAGGIGRACVERFIAEGARVVIADIDREAGNALARELGDAAAFHQTDVSDADQVQALVEFTVAHFGGLHVMLNNAGVASARAQHRDHALQIDAGNVRRFQINTGAHIRLDNFQLIEYIRRAAMPADARIRGHQRSQLDRRQFARSGQNDRTRIEIKKDRQKPHELRFRFNPGAPGLD